MDEYLKLKTGLEMILKTFEMRYEYDGSGRLFDVLGDGILPQFVLGRAVEGCVWRFRVDLESHLVNRIARLAAREPGFPIAGKTQGRPPERLAAIERLFSPEAVNFDTRHEVLTQNGVSIAEIWTLP